MASRSEEGASRSSGSKEGASRSSGSKEGVTVSKAPTRTSSGQIQVELRTSSGPVRSDAQHLLEAEVHHLRARWSEVLVKETYAGTRYGSML